MFYLDKINNKTILKSDKLSEKRLFHCFTTRETVLKSKEEGLFEQVLANKKDICNYLGIELNDLISPEQTHSSNVEIAKINQVDYPQTDALILSNNRQSVFLNFADCTPVILYDEKNNVAAIAHAGWRGTAAKIVVKTVEKMHDEFETEPNNVVAIIGPAIGGCCYCVGKEVYSQLMATIELESDINRFSEEKFYVDLKKINQQQLLAIGVKKIDICNYCTSCSNELFFSYRKESGTTSRHSAVIKLV